MNGRKLTVLTALAGVLTAGEFGSAVQIGLGRDPGGAVFAVIFGVFILDKLQAADRPRPGCGLARPVRGRRFAELAN